MAVTNQLSRIADLVDRLRPLSGKQRGMPIEADQWNVLVDALLGVLQIDRAQEETTLSTLEERFSRKDHQHLGQVTAEWLDADLQANLSGGGSAVAIRVALADLGKRMEALSSQVADLSTQVEAQQTALDRISSAEVDRSSALRGFEGRLTAVDELRGRVGTLTNQVSSLTGTVRDVLELRLSLSDAEGKPFDVAGMRKDIDGLEELRTSLEGADGKPLRLRDIELQLRDLSDAVGLGGDGGLETRFSALSSDLSKSLNDQVDERIDVRVAAVRTEVLEESAASETRLRTELTASLDESRTSLASSSAQSLAASEARLRTDLTALVASSSETNLQTVTAASRLQIDEGLAGLPDQIQSEVGSAVTDLEERLRTGVKEDVNSAIKEGLDAAEESLGGRVGEVESRMGRLEEEVPILVSKQLDESFRDFSLQVDRQIDDRMESFRQELNLNETVKSAVDASVLELDSRMQETFQARMTAGLADLDQRVDRSVERASRNQPDQIAAEVSVQIADLGVDKRIAASTDSLGKQLRTEISKAVADQQTRTSTAINGTVTLLRSETAAAVKAGAEDAVQRSRAEVLRLEGRIAPNALRTVQPVSPARPIR